MAGDYFIWMANPKVVSKMNRGRGCKKCLLCMHNITSSSLTLLPWIVLLYLFPAVTLGASLTMVTGDQSYMYNSEFRSHSQSNLTDLDSVQSSRLETPIHEGTLPSHLEFIIGIPDCPTETFIVMFVISATGNQEHRNSIRKSWGSVANELSSRTKLVFVVGLPSENTSDMSKLLHSESQKHRDILQINVVDSYKNLSLKSVAMLKWISEHCADVKYILKADDDTFVNTQLLLADLKNVVHTQFIMGDIIAGAHPIRDKQSKYFTPVSEFQNKTYPKYISGAAYVISGDIIPKLYSMALQTNLFWLEDVYITGLIAKKAGAKHIFNGKFGYHGDTLEPCQLKTKILTLHRIKPQEMYNAWNILTDQELKC